MLSDFEKEECLNNLRTALDGDDPVESMTAEIKRLIPNGMDENTATELLTVLYTNADPEKSEIIADVGDRVAGYCNNSYWIFPSDWRGDDPENAI